MPSLDHRADLVAFVSFDELVAAFTDDDGPPKVFHGMGTMLGVYPVNDEFVHWFAWTGKGLQHQFSTDTPPHDGLLEVSE